MTRRTSRSAPFIAAAATMTPLLLTGCGDDEEPKAEAVTPATVQRIVTALHSACTDMELDTPQVHDASGRVTHHVDRLIRQFSAKPDLKLTGTNLGADTLREQMAATYGLLRECKPQEANRVREAARD